MLGFLRKYICKTEKQHILKELVKYCKEKPDLDTLNKISETTSLTAMKIKNKLDPLQKETLEKAFDSWESGSKTPKEFRGLFRGGR
jgi:hypothetical protein